MFHFLNKFCKLSTYSKNFLEESLTQEAIQYILSNPKEIYVPWIKQKFPLGDNLIFIIGKLRSQNKWEHINSILPLVHLDNCQNPKLYLSLVTMNKKAEISKDFLINFIDLLHKTKDNLSLRELSECIRCLKFLKLTTKEKFSVIDLLSVQILSNIKNFSSFDKSYIIEGITLFPCEKTFKIFEEIAKDTKAKSLKELSTLCNFLCINRNKEFWYLFEEFERELLKDGKENKFLLNQAIHGFGKIGLGSKELYKYFIQKVWQGKDEIDGLSLGMILCCLLKFPGADPQDKEKLLNIFDSKKGGMKEKHLAIIKEYL